MARNENLPFDRGSYAEDGSINAVDANDPVEANLEGKEYLVEDVDISDPLNVKARSGFYVRIRAVRNISGIALLPKRLVQFSLVAGDAYPSKVIGYAALDAQHTAVVDEYLPSAGVPNNCLFWVVVGGPTLCLTAMASAIAISIGQVVVALTAAASTGTTAGRVTLQNTTLTSVTAAANFDASGLANQIQNRLGRAMSAATTSQTNTGILINVDPIGSR